MSGTRATLPHLRVNLRGVHVTFKTAKGRTPSHCINFVLSRGKAVEDILSKLSLITEKRTFFFGSNSVRKTIKVI